MVKKVLKRLLSDSAIQKLNKLSATFAYFRARMLMRSYFLSMLGIMFNNEYVREYRSMLFARANYLSGIGKGNVYFLRRSIHRLEKGMIMKPRRDEFGLRYINDAVDSFVAQNNCGHPDNTLIWAQDVLTHYFSVVNTEDERYSKAKATFLSTQSPLTRTENLPRMIPRPVLDYQSEHNISFEAFYSLLRSRKSVRWYSPVPVPREKVRLAMESANFAPSSCNRQCFTYHFAYGPLAIELAKISAGTAGWAENIPAIAIVVGDASAFPNNVNRHATYVDSILSVMPFVLSLEVQGISSCIINWSDSKGADEKMRRKLNLNQHQHIITSIAFGYADHDAEAPYSGRAGVEKLIRELN